MASRKDEKDRLRAERLAAESHDAAAARRRLMVGYVVAGVLGLAVVVGIVVVVAGSGGGGSDLGGSCAESRINVAVGDDHGLTPDCRAGTKPPIVQQANLDVAAKAAHCDLRLNLPDEGNTHVEAGTKVKYDTNPPTSGNHVVPPLQLADGAYAEFPVPIDFVHSLEHGRVEIQYSPDLPEKDQLALKGVFDASPGGMLLFPNPEMPYEVAVTAWTQLMGCDKYEGAATLDAIIDFRDAYRGNGPEPVPFTP